MFSLALASLVSFASVALAEEAAPETFGDAHPSSAQKWDGVRHGVRTGYVFVNDAAEVGLRDPNLFALGYEMEFVVAGDRKLDFIVVNNFLVLGINQGEFIPTSNVLVGLSMYDYVKFGVGANVTPDFSGNSWVHMVAAVEVAPTVGKLQLPVAVSYIPDVNGHFRVGATVGVNWPRK